LIRVDSRDFHKLLAGHVSLPAAAVSFPALFFLSVSSWEFFLTDPSKDMESSELAQPKWWQDHWWSITISLVVALLTVFLVLNGTNTLPHYDYSRLDGVISDPNSIEGRAVQLFPDGGLASYDVTAKNTAVTNGLGLSIVSARSILGNGTAETAIPSTITVPVNSVLASTSSGLSALTAVSTNHVLIFNGSDVVWGPIVDHLPNLGAGQLFIGDASGLSQPRTVTGAISVDSSGGTALNPAVVQTSNLADLSVTAAKITPGSANQVLTSGALSTEWRDPQVGVEAVAAGSQSPSTVGVVGAFPGHEYAAQNQLTVDGRTATLEFFGTSATVASGTVSLGLNIVLAASSVPALVVVPTGNFPWKCTCTLVRLTSSTGQVSVTVTEQAAVHFGTFSVAGVDWTSTVNLEAASLATDAANLNSFVCSYSSLSLVKPPP
jgi:hypothetical protein